MIDTAMLMAAGLGKRMRPLTATRPKPLVKVAGKALMDHALDRLAAGGIKTVVVNVHYLADTVEAHLRTRKDMDFRKPFICANSDNLWIDGPAETLGMMQRLWDPERMDALLLLVPLARANCHSGPGDFHMDANGRLTRRKTAHVAPFVFTGVQILSPRLLVDPPADVFSTNIFWNRAIAAGRLYGAVHQGLWFDVGTPQAIPVVESMIAHG